MSLNNLVHKYSVAMLSLVAMTLGACSEDDEATRPSVVPATPGAAIDFSVAQTPGSRTIYTDNKFQMDWVDGDKVHLFSDKAWIQNGTSGIINPKPTYDKGNVTCKYSVTTVVEHDYHANLSLLDKYPLEWPESFNEDDVFTFLGAYPVDRVAKGPAEGSWKFEMHYYTNQRVSVNSKNAAGEYTTNPDMNNAYLMARDAVTPTGQHVLLHFNPIMTTLDIHIHAHGDDHEIGTGIINGMKITGVSVIMPKRVDNGVSGGKPTFTYDLTSAHDGSTIEGGKLENGLKDCKQSVYVGIDNGDDPYVMLNEGESLSLLAFLPPIEGSQMNGTQVKIHTAGAYDFVVTLPDKDWVEEGRIDIDLPNLDPDRNIVNAWMKNLPGNMAMTHLSLPGASCVAGTKADDVTRWLRAGVRVLDMYNADQSERENICDAVAKFLADKDNSKEFVMVWGDGNDEDSDFTRMWKAEFGDACALTDASRDSFDGLTVAAARDLRVLVLKKGVKDYFGTILDDNIYKVSDGVSGSQYYIHTTSINRASDIDNIKLSGASWNVTGKLLTNNYDCQVYYINNGLNLEVAKYLASGEASTGCAGIVMIPFAGQAFDNNLNQVYGDVLLQAVIDCNYKFIIDLK